MANEQNQNTQDTQNSGSTGNFGDEQNSTADFGQNFGTSGGSGTSTKTAKDEGSMTSAVETAKDTAKGVLDQAKETAGQAYELAADKAATKLEDHKTTLAGGLTSVADSLKQAGESLRGGEENPITELTAKYGDSLATQIEQIGGYFERTDVRALVRDVESFARRNPAIFIGAAFGLGFLAARFLKSSPSRATQNSESQTTVNPS